MNNFKEMWDFEVKEGVCFKHCSRVHPLMQQRVQSVLHELRQDGNIKKIVLFGSSLEFRCSSFSDIDLYIERTDPAQPLKTEPAVDCELDFIMDLDHANRLYREIDQKGLLLYERSREDV